MDEGLGRSMSCSLLMILLFLLVLPHTFAKSGAWKNARATFYGPPEGTVGGACGYEDNKESYGAYTTALSTALFKNAERCGACYEITCVNSTSCKPGGNTVVVTATDFCPPNWGAANAWCNPPSKHFDMSQPAFLQIADLKAGVVPVHYRKVKCKRSGGAKFTITGNPSFNLIEVTNVGGGGDVEKVEVKAEGAERWIMLKRNWGEKWETDEKLAGNALTFRVTTTDGRFITSHNVAPKGWQFGQTFEGQNF